jgi:hypothetical protein
MVKLRITKGSKKRETVWYPLELLQTRYAIIRDEILWREYRKRLSENREGSKKHALKVLKIIRDSPS